MGLQELTSKKKMVPNMVTEFIVIPRTQAHSSPLQFKYALSNYVRVTVMHIQKTLHGDTGTSKQK